MANRSVERLRGIEDPRVRAGKAADAMRKKESEVAELRTIRDKAMDELINGGTRPAEVARVVGTSRALVSKMYPPRE
jgi:hypothetical protein